MNREPELSADDQYYMLDKKLINYLWLYQKINILFLVVTALSILITFAPPMGPTGRIVAQHSSIKLYCDFFLFSVTLFNMLFCQILKTVEIGYRDRLKYSLTAITTTVVLLASASHLSRVIGLTGGFGYIGLFLVVNAAFAIFYWKLLFERGEKYNPGTEEH